MSTTRHHADWLSLVEVSGPFISLPVLMRAFPQGLEPRDSVQAKLLRAAYEEWQDKPMSPGMQRAWIMHVLTSVLSYPENQITQAQTLPAGLEANMPEMGETLRPDFALVGPPDTATASQPQLLIANYPLEQGLDKPVIGKHWKATPTTRMMELLHAANVPLGLVTNGEHWMLIYAPRSETTGYVSWYAALWLDEPITLRAFHSLLGVRRFFGVAADNTLAALLKESASDQQEVTDQLGYQVREAVEVLVQAFDALDQESQRARLSGIEPGTVYDAALTVMMRLVFLFSAEERGLLHLGKPLYDDNYAVSTLQEQLQEVADRYGEEVLERRYDAWSRLLATFRAVHGGIRHQNLRMQAYGGSLFDPDRYPFLEGRAVGSKWRTTPAEPLAVNNRVVLHLLNSLQRLRTKVGGGMAETRRVSFRALGVEQIGHVYEGLLDHTAVRVTEVVLGIRGTRKKEPEIALSKLEALLAESEDKLLDYLKEETDRSVSALRRELREGRLIDDHKLLLACNHDQGLLARLRPFVGLIREDSFERPWVVLPGSVFVTAGTTRRSTGTHYTPPSLTEPIVHHTLEPLVYVGPAEGLRKEEWKLKSPKEILELKVCDMAMGSGAFLVQACRYLAERLVEAWDNEEKAHPGEVLITPDGQFSKGSPAERLVPAEAAERIAIARRVVADRCLYGVDINPMAVEMAKLSMWLITVDASRPFTFLDHAFKRGDSLLGITSLDQLETFSMRSEGGEQHVFATLNLWRHIDAAAEKRKALEAMPSDTPEQVAAKAALYAHAEEAVDKLHSAADVLLSVELTGLKGKAYKGERELAADHMMAYWARGLNELRDYARQRLGHRQSFHWTLAYPEIMASGGFDAVIGNPPYLGAPKLTGTFGEDYRNFLIASLANGAKGLADLSAYFVLRTKMLLQHTAHCGFVVTSAIAEGDTRLVGLEQLCMLNWTITRARSRANWRGTANVTYSAIWMSVGEWKGEIILNSTRVDGITSMLTATQRVAGQPARLAANSRKSFNGVKVYGEGFVITPAEAQTLLDKDPKNKEVIFPYITTKDVNSHYAHEASAYAIRFFDWPLDRESAPESYSGPVASDFPDCLAIVEDRVKPERTRRNDEGEFVLRKPMPQLWWIYGEKRPGLYAAISTLKHVLAVGTQATKYVSFALLEPEMVFSHSLSIITDDSFFFVAVLHSNLHEAWARHYGGYNLALLRYSPTDLFETYPFPRYSESLERIGFSYHQTRQSIMRSRHQGFTELLNRVHDPQEQSAEIVEFRRLQCDLDNCLLDSYGWPDIKAEHGFRDTDQGIRFTISETARREVLDRLLALNHQRHAEEVAAAAAQEAAKPAKRGSKNKEAESQVAIAF